MPDTDLGQFAGDPRFTATATFEGGTERVTFTIDTEGPRTTIVQSRGGFQIWRHPSHGSHLVDILPTAVAALSYVLGDPMQVGPVGMSGWLHTDGRVYLHDPATSAYMDADAIRVGDVIAYAGRPDTVVLERDHFTTDLFGRRLNGFWARRLDTGEEGAVPYGDAARFPVRFRN